MYRVLNGDEALVEREPAMSIREPRRQRQRGREYFALICALLVTLAIGRVVMPPQASGPILLQVVVYVLLYGTSYSIFWWLGGRFGSRVH